jgi:hypothetical protein
MARLPGVHAERTTPLIIVGAAILADGRLLACQRSEPPEVAGRWEFPGGKVEPGEDELEALVRECAAGSNGGPGSSPRLKRRTRLSMVAASVADACSASMSLTCISRVTQVRGLTQAADRQLPPSLV